MVTFDSETFLRFRDRESGARFSDFIFRRCVFDNCLVSISEKPDSRSTFRNVEIVDCSQRSCTLYAAIVEDVLIDGLRTEGQVFHTWGAVFKHVTLQGKIDRMMISPAITAGLAHPKVQQAFDEANAAYYENVDWALDISKGEFRELCIRGLASRWIRRDPETQIVVTREKALQGDWRELEFQNGLFGTSLNLMLEREETDIVLIAPKRHRKFKRYLADLELLRNTGIAEPD